VRDSARWEMEERAEAWTGRWGRDFSHPIYLVLLCNSFAVLLRSARLFMLTRNKYQAGGGGELNKQRQQAGEGAAAFFASISRTHYNKMTLRARMRRMRAEENFHSTIL
jgi:hypothetical protein